MKYNVLPSLNAVCVYSINKDLLMAIGRDFPIITVRIMREGSVYEHAAYREGYRETARITSLNDLLKIIR